MPEIKDEKSLEAWLETRPPEDAIVIAARAALRALPGMGSLFLPDRIADPYAIILPVFRASAVAHSANNRPTSRLKVKDAFRSIAAAVRSVAPRSTIANSALSVESAARPTVFAAWNAALSAGPVSNDRSAMSATRACDFTATSALFAANAPYAATLSAEFPGAALARSKAVATVWNAIQGDAEMLEPGAAISDVKAVPLWPDGPPEGLAEAWPALRDGLLEADEGWQVWTDWYQDRLDGRPIDEALEIEKALIPDTDWEKGPAHVNAIIAELIVEHSKQPKETITILEWLGGNALRLALADWNLDQMDQFMQLVPFSNDYRDLTSDAEKQARREGLRTLRDAMTEMAEDVEDLRLNPQWIAQLIRNLQRYANEADKGADRALPGNLQRHGRNLRETWLNAEYSKALGETMNGRLGGLVDEHTNWMRLYLSGTLERMQHLNEVALPAGMTSADLTSIIRAGVDAVINNDWSTAKPPADGDKAVLIDMAEEMERLNAERDASANDPARQAYLDEEIRRNGIISGATLVRFGLQSARATKDSVAIAADAKTLWPETFDTFFEAIRAIFEKTSGG